MPLHAICHPCKGCACDARRLVTAAFPRRHDGSRREGRCALGLDWNPFAEAFGFIPYEGKYEVHRHDTSRLRSTHSSFFHPLHASSACPASVSKAARGRQMHTAATRKPSVNHSESTARMRSAVPADVPGIALGTGDRVASRLGLGTHSLHRLLTRSARQNHLHQAFDLGIRYFDTAPSYGAGLAEREVGRLARRRRSALIIASKFGIAPKRWAAAMPGGTYLAAAAGTALAATGWRRAGRRAPHRDYGVSAMRDSVEASLRRLHTDYLDILFLHAPQLHDIGDGEQLATALEALRKSGKARRIGLSGDAHQCEQIARHYPTLCEVLQIEIPTDSDGLPSSSILGTRAAIGFWEFPPNAAHWPVLAIFERLMLAVPTGIILLSSHDAAVLREIIAHLRQRRDNGEDGPVSASVLDPGRNHHAYVAKETLGTHASHPA